MLSTVDADRGVHAVPVCFTVVDDLVAVPIDTVKAKRSTDLRRSANTAADPRATLLVDHWDRHDWQQLWWVRADLTRLDDAVLDPAVVRRLEAGLRDRYPQYRDAPFAGVLVFHVDRLTGWSAT